MSGTIARSCFYGQPCGESEANLALMRLIDEAFLECPFYSARQMVRTCADRAIWWAVKRIRRLMHKMGLGFLYLVAVMDWASRKVLAWRLSNTMDADFWVAALEEAIARYGRPDIFNTDHGSQFTRSQFTDFAFIDVLKDNGIRISMDGKGRWMDNVFIESLWRSLKYETGGDAQDSIGHWIVFFNERRPHSSP